MDTRYSLLSVDEVTSTQDVARASYQSGPLLVVAARQTGGRGRVGHGWESAPRALAASLVFEPSWPIARWGPIPLVAGIAARRACPVQVGLKWPNDLMIEDLKVGGILVEAFPPLVVIGCGIDLWWADQSGAYGAIWEDDPGPDAAAEIAHAFTRSVLATLAGHPGEWGRLEYIAACSTLQRKITWQPAGEGTAVAIDFDGALIVETPAGLQRLLSAEVDTVRG
jgi:BirA family biotin operon repressor/biotin-[acetyl-CoA-carboxylase] ligase